jgi:hypothetical protein
MTLTQRARLPFDNCKEDISPVMFYSPATQGALHFMVVSAIDAGSIEM